MAKKQIFIFIIVGLTAYSCKEVAEKKLNGNDFEAIKSLIEKSDSLSTDKKKFIIDNLARDMTSLPEPAPTFRDQIAKIGVDYEINRRLIENNKKLKNLLKLKEVEAIPFDGTLNMKFQCSNTFDKGILYAIVEYRYVDRYDNTILKKTVKITDELANGFKNGDFEVTMRGLSITLSDFNFERRDKKVFLNDLTVDVLNIVFSDKSSIGNL